MEGVYKRGLADHELNVTFTTAGGQRLHQKMVSQVMANVFTMRRQRCEQRSVQHLNSP